MRLSAGVVGASSRVALSRTDGRCARKWVGRYRAGDRQLHDRSSVPRTVANRTPADRVAVIMKLRGLRMTAAEIAETLRPETGADPIACIWDLSVVAHERVAWIRNILAADVPSLDAYLVDTLRGMV